MKSPFTMNYNTIPRFRAPNQAVFKTFCRAKTLVQNHQIITETL